MTTISTATQRGVLASFALLLISMMLSAQALALEFDDGGLSYDVINATDVEMTGRALGNTDADIAIPDTAVDGTTTYSVKTIGYEAFMYNDLNSVTISDSVTTIGEHAFKGNDLNSVTIPNSVKSIGKFAFEDAGLTSVTIGESVETIGYQAFVTNSLESLTIPDSVKTIGELAFAYNSLTSVTIGNSVETIGDYAFAVNELTSVTIPDSVTSIGRGAFFINTLNSAAFLGNFGTFNLDMFGNNTNLATITYGLGATGWDNPQRTFTPRTGPTGSVTATAAPAPAATPVPTSPLWLLGMMAGLLSLVAVTKLRKA